MKKYYGAIALIVLLNVFTAGLYVFSLYQTNADLKNQAAVVTALDKKRNLPNDFTYKIPANKNTAKVNSNGVSTWADPQTIAVMIIDFNGDPYQFGSFSKNPNLYPAIKKRLDELANYYKISSYGAYQPKFTIFYDTVRDTPFTLDNVPSCQHYSCDPNTLAQRALALCHDPANKALSCFGLTGQGPSVNSLPNVPSQDPAKRFDALVTIPIATLEYPDFVTGVGFPVYQYGFTDPWGHHQSFAYIMGSTTPILWPDLGRLAHETGHVIGLDHPPFGDWDVMSFGYGNFVNGVSFPTALTAWSKLVKGWITPRDITMSGTYTLGLSELDKNQFFKIPVNNPNRPGEFYLVEYRKGETGVTRYGNLIDWLGGDDLRCGAPADSGRLFVYDVDPASIARGSLYDSQGNFRTKFVYAINPLTNNIYSYACDPVFGFTSSIDTPAMSNQRKSLTSDRATNLDGSPAGVTFSAITSAVDGRSLSLKIDFLSSVELKPQGYPNYRGLHYLEVDEGKDLTLTWSAQQASNCIATSSPARAEWAGPIAVSGSKTIKSINQNTFIGLNCDGRNGKVADFIDVVPKKVIPPIEVYLKPVNFPLENLRDVHIPKGETLIVDWTSKNAAKCTATSSSQVINSWKGAVATAGTQSVGPLSEYVILGLVCENGSNKMSGMLEVFPDLPAPPKIAITGAPTLSFEYEEAKGGMLKGRYGAVITAGTEKVLVPVTAGLSDYVVNTVGLRGGFIGRSLSPLGGAVLSTVACNNNKNQCYSIPAGQTLKFNVTSTYDPLKMFAGVYTLKVTDGLLLDSQDSFFSVSIIGGEKTSAPVAVVGEKSPYIDDVVFDAKTNSITVLGQRFDLGGPVTAKISDVLSRVIPISASRIVIPLAGFNLIPTNKYNVVITNSHGSSNGYGLNLSTEPTSTSTTIRQ